MILFSKEKIGVIFFIRKKTIRGGGGPGGGLAKDHKKYVFFLLGTLPLHTMEDDILTDVFAAKDRETHVRVS